MCRRVQGSQIFKQNWIISIRSRVIVILPIWVSSALGGVGQVGEGCPGWSAIVYMSLGMFRDKESSNKIELSRSVQDLLNFGVLGSLRLWGLEGWVDGGGGGWRVPPTHVHMHAHAHMCMCTRTCGKHDNFIQMAAPIGGNPGNSLWCHMHIHVCAHACMHVHVCMCGGTLSPPTPTSIHHPPPGGPPEWVKIQ